METEPTAMAVTRPASETVAVEVAPEDQVTEEVMFCVVPSEKEPVAVSCDVSPAGAAGLPGVIAIDWSVAGVTVSVVLPETLPKVADMVDGPSAIPVATPVTRIDAKDVVPDSQFTEVVMLRVEASE
jgi:hypothetical protein